MEINLQDMTIKFRGSEEDIYDLAAEFSSKNIAEILEILNETNQGLPRILKTRALRLVLNDFVRIAKELPITTELLHRLNWYKEYSDYQLSKLFTTLANSGDVRFNENELIAKYKTWLWVVTLSNANNLGITDETLKKISEVEDEYQGFEDFNNILNESVYDFKGSLDVVPQEDFLRVLFKSSTVAELRDIAKKYEINVPKRLNRAQLLEVILQRLEEDGKYDEAVVAKVKDMKVVSLQRFAKDNDIKASTELRKDAVIDFILKAVENNQTNLKSLPLVNLIILPEEEFEMKPEFIREIDSRYFYEFDEDGEIISMSDAEDLKAQIEALKEQLANSGVSTEETVTTETIEEYDMDPITRRMRELERQIVILSQNQKDNVVDNSAEVEELRLREIELLNQLEEANLNDSTEEAERLAAELEEVKNRQEEITVTEVVTTEYIEEDNEEAIRLAAELDEARAREEELLAREEEARLREEELKREIELLTENQRREEEREAEVEELRLREIELLTQLEEANLNESTEEAERLAAELEEVKNRQEEITVTEVVTTEIIEEENEEAIRLAAELDEAREELLAREEEARLREEELKREIELLTENQRREEEREAEVEELRLREIELLTQLEEANLNESTEEAERLAAELEEVKNRQEEITVTEVVTTEIIEEENEEAIRLAAELEEAKREIEMLTENQRREEENEAEIEALRIRELQLVCELDEARTNESNEEIERLTAELEAVQSRQDEITVTEVVTTEIIEEENEEAIRLAAELDDARVREEELLRELELAKITNSFIETAEITTTTEIVEEDNEEAIRLAAELEEAKEREEELKAQEEILRAREEELLRELEVARLSNSVEQEEILMQQLEEVKSLQEEIVVTEVVTTEIIEEDNEEAIRLSAELEESRAREEELLRELEEKDQMLEDLDFENLAVEDFENSETMVISETETTIVEELEELQEFIPEDLEFDDELSIEDIDLMDEIDPTSLEEEPVVVEETVEQHEIYSLDDSTLSKKQLKAKKEVTKLLKQKMKLEKYKKMKDSKLVKSHKRKRAARFLFRLLMLLLVIAIYLFIVVAGIYRNDNGITSLLEMWQIDGATGFGAVHVEILDSISIGNYQTIYDFVGKAHDAIMAFLGF